jgi:CubicO group peptidase (beta-lactamase class C family)
MDEGQIVYSEGYGTADKAHNIPAGASTLYNIGSVSKTFCATAVMLLVDDGKISLDAPVKNYIPDFNMTDPRYENITVRMLLDHTSGLSSTTWVNDIGYEANPNFYSDLLNQLSESTLNANPGEYGPYCNEGYNMAELLVARVSGESYIDFLNQRIIKPLSLYSTGLCVGEQTGKNIAYYYQPDGTQVPPEILSLVGAGGLSSTAEDLVRFADSFSVGGKHILSQASIDEVIKPHLSTFAEHSLAQNGVNPEFHYGLGLDIAGLPAYKQQGVYLIGKGGDTEDYHSTFLSATDKRVSVAVIQTGPGNMAGRIAKDVLNAVLLAKGQLQSIPGATEVPAAVSIPAGYSAFQGYYAPKFSVSFNYTSNTCQVATVEASGTSAPLDLTYHGNYFLAADGTTKFKFITVDGQNCLLVSYLGDLVYTVYGQQIPQLQTPQSLSSNINGVQWLRRNIGPYEQTPPTLAPSHILTSATLTPGYVLFDKIKVVTSGTTAAIPVKAVRDQTDLVLFDVDGATWAKAYDIIYSNTSVATPLKTGANQATIGSSGYNEWFTATGTATVTVQGPATIRVFVFSADGAPIYDSRINTGAMTVNQGCYIEVASYAGDAFTLTTT